jgi:hypothetical protein
MNRANNKKSYPVGTVIICEGEKATVIATGTESVRVVWSNGSKSLLSPAELADCEVTGS